MNARGTVLCVDDEPALLSSLEAVLKLSGFCVATAATGSAALEKLAGDDDIDLVLLDCCLPDADGLKLVTIIKKLKPAVRVVVCSGEWHQDDAVGADAVLMKPFRPQELVETIARLLPDAPARTGT